MRILWWLAGRERGQRHPERATFEVGYAMLGPRRDRRIARGDRGER